jgi:hypothetical protein
MFEPHDAPPIRFKLGATPEDPDGRRLKRDPPNVRALVGLLNDHEVRYVVTGSVAAMLYGVALEPGDLDITPARDYEDLARLAHVLGLIEARQYADEPFGEWETDTDGEQRWVLTVGRRVWRSPGPLGTSVLAWLRAARSPAG